MLDFLAGNCHSVSTIGYISRLLQSCACPLAGGLLIPASCVPAACVQLGEQKRLSARHCLVQSSPHAAPVAAWGCHGLQAVNAAAIMLGRGVSCLQGIKAMWSGHLQWLLQGN